MLRQQRRQGVREEGTLDDVYPSPSGSRDAAARGQQLAPEFQKDFATFERRLINGSGRLSERTRHLILVAAAHITGNPYCIRLHTLAALQSGISQEEIMEAIWTAVGMSAGATRNN